MALKSLILCLPLTLAAVAAQPAGAPRTTEAAVRPRVVISTDIGGTDPDDTQSLVHFLLSADMFDVEGLKVWPYVIRSTVPALDGQSGRFTAVPPPAERTRRASVMHAHWWTDDPDPAAAEGIHPGAKSVNRWREDFLRDFEARLHDAAIHSNTSSLTQKLTLAIGQ